LHLITLHLLDGQTLHLQAPDGANLRQWLLQAGYSPYTRYTQRLNCGGRGLCATCGVWIEAGAPAPGHWHDQLAMRFGYPRLSCQIRIDGPMVLRQVDKMIWGGPE
jgi:ferredoxin